MKKIYVLDTNVLLHDPYAILKFEDNNYTTQTSDPVCGTVSYEGTMQNNSTMGSYTYQEGGSGSYSGDRS